MQQADFSPNSTQMTTLLRSSREVTGRLENEWKQHFAVKAANLHQCGGKKKDLEKFLGSFVKMRIFDLGYSH